MKKIILSLCIFLLLICYPYSAKHLLAAEVPEDLYATAAVLMDGSNQRVLFGKEETTELPMASTTKIMTCLYALEHGNLSDKVTFSSTAASAPKVHLGASEGDQFLLSDLLYALMLESYNDVAIAIAEHISGSVEDFCQAMTEQARSYGCYHTCFETPNGLDSDNHYTTCTDLAVITCHALANKDFRAIISESSYTIKELTNGQSYTLNNKNAFLSSYPDAIGVKTGYTGKAGYCFVGAVETGDRLLISVVLGSGWPPNRTYKWTDTRKLMDYGKENFTNTTISLNNDIPTQLPVEHGQTDICEICSSDSATLLLNESESVSIDTDIPNTLSAPVSEGDAIGSITLSIDGEVYRTYPVTAKTSVKEINYSWCLEQLLQRLFLSK